VTRNFERNVNILKTLCISVIIKYETKLKIVEDEAISKQICKIKKIFYEVAVSKITFCVKLKCQSLLYTRCGVLEGKKDNNTAFNFVREIF